MIGSKLTYCLILLLFTTFLSGQNVSEYQDYSPKKILKLANDAKDKGDVYLLIDILEIYLSKVKDDYKIKLLLADQYQYARDYKRAKQLYGELLKEDKSLTIAMYHYAQMCKRTKDYNVAIEYFKKYKKKHNGKEYKKNIKIDIKGCVAAHKLFTDTVNAELFHLDTSINKAHIEFSPIIQNDTSIIFASLREDSIKYYLWEDQEKPLRRFYTAVKRDDEWVYKDTLKGPINSLESHTGNGAYSIDRRRFFFTRCQLDWQNKAVCRIYYSDKRGRNWGDPVPLGFDVNYMNFTSTMPTVSLEPRKRKEILYFVSDRPGGRGGMDIWCSEYDSVNTVYKKPRNLGGKINTVGDEITPFYHQETRTMYFSSDGWPTIGGFDVFKSTGMITRWKKPTNIGVPLNSSVDDLYYALNNNKEDGFLVSNRAGGVALKSETCCDDIYSFKIYEYLHIGVNGRVIMIQDTSLLPNMRTKAGIDSLLSQNNNLDIFVEDGIEISLYMLDEEGDALFLAKDTLIDGRFFFDLEQGNEYQIIVEKYCDITSEILTSSQYLKVSDTIDLKPIIVDLSYEKPIEIKNVRYEFAKANLMEETKKMLDTTLIKILRKRPDLIVELSAHTDSVGTDEANMKLSQDRANSVVNHCIDQGIDKKRLIPKGYGESKPIAANTNPDGTDNPEGRARNRRTEFKMVGAIGGKKEYLFKEDNTYYYLSRKQLSP